MPSVLVTGPRGLLGSTLVRVLRDAGMDVHPFDGDITDVGSLNEFASVLSALDVVVHTAAMTDINRCETDQTRCTEVNVEGTRHVRDLATRFGARLVYISTVSLFSGENGNYREDDPVDPRNHYNRTKADAERVVAEYGKSLILRVNINGIHPDGSRGRNFIEWLVDSFRGNLDMNLFTDVRINPLSNWTLAELIRDLIQRWPDARVLHLGSRTLLSKADIGRRIATRFPSYAGTITTTSVDRMSAVAFRPKEMWLNVDRAEALGFTMPTLEDEVARILTHIT